MATLIYEDLVPTYPPDSSVCWCQSKWASTKVENCQLKSPNLTGKNVASLLFQLEFL